MRFGTLKRKSQSFQTAVTDGDDGEMMRPADAPSWIQERESQMSQDCNKTMASPTGEDTGSGLNRITKPDHKLEYSTCIDFWKHSAGVQVAQMSMFVVTMSGMAYFLFGRGAPPPEAKMICRLAAGFVAISFWMSQESHAYLASRCHNRARNLERSLGFDLFSSMPKVNLYLGGPLHWAYRMLYLGFTIFWFWATSWTG